MKQSLFLIIFFIVSITAVSADETLFCTGIDWQLSIRGGIEYRMLRHLGIRADAGAAVYGLLVCDAFIVVYLRPPGSSFQCMFLAGIPNAAVTFDFTAAMVSCGGSIMVRYWFNEKFGMDLRAGGGFPFFFEKEKEVIRVITFPFGLWPDLVLAVSLRL
ncbi:MAG: hypothetical protein JW881_17550 [Spirochaetales bacterium]|nr:hypothetical protein [Spirochaetales bacterium]